MKIQFYKQHRKKDYWQILEDLHYNTSYGRVIVPAWFVLDMGSIPRIVWRISHPLKYPEIIAFVLHDWRYSKKNNELTRKEADLEFFELLCINNKIKAYLFYYAVRLFWWFAYKKPLPFNK